MTRRRYWLVALCFHIGCYTSTLEVQLRHPEEVRVGKESDGNSEVLIPANSGPATATVWSGQIPTGEHLSATTEVQVERDSVGGISERWLTSLPLLHGDARLLVAPSGKVIPLDAESTAPPNLAEPELRVPIVASLEAVHRKYGPYGYSVTEQPGGIGRADVTLISPWSNVLRIERHSKPSAMGGLLLIPGMVLVSLGNYLVSRPDLQRAGIGVISAGVALDIVGLVTLLLPERHELVWPARRGK
jgi:hypothetical protein